MSFYKFYQSYKIFKKSSKKFKIDKKFQDLKKTQNGTSLGADFFLYIL